MLVGPASIAVKTMADLAGKRIGIPRGAMQDIVLSQSAPAGAQIMRFDDQATAVQALIAGPSRPRRNRHAAVSHHQQ